MKTTTTVTFTLALVAVLGGSIFFLNQYEHKKAREREARRIEAEQKRIALEKEQERIEQEKEAELQRIALEEERRRAKEREEQQRILALKKQVEERRERERMLIEMPVVLFSNNVVKLSFGSGDIVHFNSDGLILRSENGLLPRTPWNAITEDDARVLLKTPKVFAALASYGYKNTKDLAIVAPAFETEKQMSAIWNEEKSVREKVITRIVILRLFQEYMDARAAYFGSLAASRAYAAKSAQAEAKAEEAARPKAGAFLALSPEGQTDYLTGRIGGSPSDVLRQIAVNQIMNRPPDYSQADQLAKISASTAGGANTSAAKMRDALEKLAAIGVTLPSNGDWPVAPAMNLKRDVVIEINSLEVK